MRITFIMPRHGASGGARVVALYAERLAARGHAVHIVWQATPKRRLVRSLRTLFRPEPRLRRGDKFFDHLPGIVQSVSQRPDRVIDADLPDGDVVIATWWETAYSVAALSPAKGEKIYFIQHHEVHGYLPSHISRGTYYLPLRKITISQWLVDTMRDEYGDTDVALVENSVDMRQFDAPPREKNTPPTVGFLYSGKKFKGVDVSLRAIAAARQAVPDLGVLAFGTTPLKPHLPLPEGAIYFRDPPQDELRGIYAMCDVWLCGSHREGFHLPPLEAMACRTPVVSTRVGGAFDVITEGVNGHLAEPGDAEALAARLIEVARLSPEAWRRMSDAAHARARAYSWDDATDRFEALLAAGPARTARRVG